MTQVLKTIFLKSFKKLMNLCGGVVKLDTGAVYFLTKAKRLGNDLNHLVASKGVLIQRGSLNLINLSQVCRKRNQYLDVILTSGSEMLCRMTDVLNFNA